MPYKPFLVSDNPEHLRKRDDGPSTPGDGGSTFGGMSDRITALETHFGYVRRDIDDLKVAQAQTNQKLDQVLGRMSELPTKNDLWSWKIQYTALSVAAIALIVGGIIGGLSWIAP